MDWDSLLEEIKKIAEAKVEPEIEFRAKRLKDVKTARILTRLWPVIKTKLS